MSEARAKIARVLINVAVRVQSVSVRRASQFQWGWVGRPAYRSRTLETPKAAMSTLLSGKLGRTVGWCVSSPAPSPHEERARGMR